MPQINIKEYERTDNWNNGFYENQKSRQSNN